SASLLARRTPISVLVANFNSKGLNHRELETLLHEFGHVLHGVLSRTRYASHGGTNVERDFVEAPSQMYEEWGRKVEPLRLIRRYCSGCPEVDEALVKRLRAAHSFGRGIQYGRQHLYASYDLALFRELILARGGQRPAGEMVREFLGRDPSPKAFFEEITGQRGG